ncbi:biliverdin-producing heme oxygenase [Terricaulis sp.]|uniref:biliverdin-producing heme oxygenase n=1 Tax=Terricaulis sp. TaxID=2768686 RepID=UPI0037834FB5
MDIATNAPRAAARDILRDACRGTHARLDQRLSQVDFNDRDGYAAMLAQMSAPLTALESALSSGIAPVLFDNWAARLRAHALRRDLSALERPVHERFGAPVEDEAAALGVLYVLEGSRLGGQMLARMARASTDDRVRSATAFFTHGAGGGLWRTYLARLEASEAVKRQPENAVRAALAAFGAFEAAFA